MRLTMCMALAVALALPVAAPRLAGAQERGERDGYSRNETDSRDRAESGQRDRRLGDGILQRRNRDTDRFFRSLTGQRGQDDNFVQRSGEILRLKKVSLRGERLEHAVALLRTSGDKRAVVDLGPVKQLKDLKLRQGDRIGVRGRPMRVGERGVLMATRVRKEGEKSQIDRRAPERLTARRAVRRSGFRGQQQQEMTEDRQRPSARDRDRQRQGQGEGRRRASVRGDVEQTKRVRVRNLGTDHLVALVRIEDGGTRIVDLGPVEDLQSVRLAQGDTIAALGNVVAVGDRQVLMAERLRKDGQETRIRRGQRSEQQRSRSQRRGSNESPRQPGRSDSSN